jgi:curved DNA-binding protein CbpA
VTPSAPDPYTTLGVSASSTDAELRSAYRRLVQLHHPDHNGGSAESEHRFEEIQDAYARVRELRAGGTRASATGARASAAGARTAAGATTPPADGDPISERLRAMERELHEEREARERELRHARDARERAARVAREAAAATGKNDLRQRATDEELGRYETDDSFAKILADVRSDVTELFGKAISAAERAAEEAARRAADRRADRRDD